MHVGVPLLFKNNGAYFGQHVHEVSCLNHLHVSMPSRKWSHVCSLWTLEQRLGENCHSEYWYINCLVKGICWEFNYVHCIDGNVTFHCKNPIDPWSNWPPWLGHVSCGSCQTGDPVSLYSGCDHKESLGSLRAPNRLL